MEMGNLTFLLGLEIGRWEMELLALLNLDSVCQLMATLLGLGDSHPLAILDWLGCFFLKIFFLMNNMAKLEKIVFMPPVSVMHQALVSNYKSRFLLLSLNI